MPALLRKLRPIALPALPLLLLAIIVHRVLETPQWSFNGSRLMPSFALANGLNYYVTFPPGGPLYNSLYGPLVALVYLPAILFHSVNGAVLAGGAITALLCFSGAALLHFGPRRLPREKTDVLAFLAAAFLMCYLEPLKYSCFNIHADGPGLAFGAMACAAALRAREQNSNFLLLAAALGAVLSVFCKQMFLPLPFVILAYVAIVRGRGAAIRFLGWTAVIALSAAGAAMWAWGPDRLYHCLIWVPEHQPWYPPSPAVSGLQAWRSFIRVSMPVPILLAACAIYLAVSRKRSNIRDFFSQRAALPLLAGVALLPFSIAGRAKQGGDVNSLSFALFFLTCGLTLMLADAARDASSDTNRRLARSSLIATILVVVLSEAPLVLDLRAAKRRMADAPQQIAFNYLARHPGQAYFPWMPAAHYYAEHRFWHFGFGVADRLMAGEAITESDFRAYIPSDARIVAFAADGTPQLLGYNLMRYLPEYTRQIDDPELPGWLVYAKPDPASR